MLMTAPLAYDQGLFPGLLCSEPVVVSVYCHCFKLTVEAISISYASVIEEEEKISVKIFRKDFFLIEY